MDLGLPRSRAAEADQSGANKRSRKGPEEGGRADGGMDRLLALVAKLSLNTAMRARIISSVTMENVIIKGDADYAMKAHQAGQEFAKAAQAAGSPKDREALAPPMVWVWNALVEAARASKDEEVVRAAADYCEKAMQAADTQDKRVAIIIKEVKYARVSKTYERSLKRLEVSILPDSPSCTLWEAMKKDMVKNHSAKVKIGVPPKIDLERRIQEILDKRGEVSG